MTELVNVTYGNGPFREVRLLVDGQLAGVAFPYPVVFTGRNRTLFCCYFNLTHRV
jgi:hypothetical protein